MPKRYDQSVFKDGQVKIFRRTIDGPFYSELRINGLPNLRKMKSLSSKDQNLAKIAALDDFEDLKYRHRKGLPVFEVQFAHAAGKFQTELQAKAERGYIKQKYADRTCSQLDEWTQYFKGQPINDVTTADIDTFPSWREKWILTEQQLGRKLKSKPALGKKALHDSQAALIQLLNWAHRQDWIGKNDIPVVNKYRSDERRFAVTDADYKKMLNSMPLWRKGCFKTEDNYIREQFCTFVRFLSGTGLRANEAYALQWKHIGKLDQFGDKLGFAVVVPTATKTGTRTVIAPGPLYKMLVAQKGMYFSRWPFNPIDDDYVFCTWARQRRKEYRGHLPSLLKFAKCGVHPSGKPYTLYSLRHRYATTQLIAGANINDLARNMGTSVEMIERHYSHVQTKDVAERLLQTKEGHAFFMSTEMVCELGFSG